MARRSNDKATRSHIETLRYVERTEVSPGDSIPWSRLGDRNVGSLECTLIGPTECGDYSNNALVGESNFRCMRESFPWLVEIYGSHGYRVLAYLGKRENQSDELIETIDALSDYPLVSDDDHSELECERESEAWDEDGADDFRKALAPIVEALDTVPCPACASVVCPECGGEPHPCDHCEVCDGGGTVTPFEHDLDLISDDDLRSLWLDGCDAYNVNGGSGFTNKQGDSIHFYIDYWIERYERNPHKAPYHSHTNPDESFESRLRTLAEVSRVHNVPDDVLMVTRDAWLIDANGDTTIALLNARVPAHFQAAVLYAWEHETHTTEESETANG